MGSNQSTARVNNRKKHKCLHCNKLFHPDPRNSHHQKYCSKPECRKASKAAAQRRWVSSSKGEGCYSGKFNVERVQRWRKEHPDYCKHTRKKPAEPLQDFLNSQRIENKEDIKNEEISVFSTLQDLCLPQPALFIGLIASLTGITLQDDIVQTVRRFIDSGQDILGTAIKSPTLERSP
ncbi:MAG TPA: hypothetical protein VHP36_03640 [Chitinispirillaceae bacterium]|nr:hypothetical protein [Chitinispirillaceae bacterium]